jgi:hypothetical protein
MPSAIVDFLTFDREVRSPIGRSLPVAVALTQLAAYQPDLRNGSRLDDALKRADVILQKSAAPVRRVLVVTDGLTRSALTAEEVGASTWQSGALIHMAIVTTGPPKLTRDDDSPWAALPRRTGGVYWTASAEGELDSGTRIAFEEWARPKRIDKLEVAGLPAGFGAPDVLNEGEGLEHFVVASAEVPRVEIRGQVWSKPFHTALVAGAEQAKLAAALFFGTGLENNLSEAEQMKLAMRGGVVSPVTSYLAIEPGVRPSTEGLDWGVSGIGEGGGGFGEGYGRGSFSGMHHVRVPAVDKDAWLRTELTAASRACGLKNGEVTLELETTLDEIVDIAPVQIAPHRETKAEACVRDAMWNLALPGAFMAPFEAYRLRASL